MFIFNGKDFIPRIADLEETRLPFNAFLFINTSIIFSERNGLNSGTSVIKSELISMTYAEESGERLSILYASQIGSEKLR